MDDHLRNHGFILTEKDWVLSTAYDLNPSVDKDGLALNIALAIDLAKRVGEYLRLNPVKWSRLFQKFIRVYLNGKKSPLK